MTNYSAKHAVRTINGLEPTQDRLDQKRSNPSLILDPRTYKRSLDCVHCGLCLPSCPTYTQNGLEADSPRGRIVLIKGMADGKIDPTDSVLQHLDLCLDCRACETACPSGVVYHELIENTRAQLASRRHYGLIERIIRGIFLHIMTNPNRLKLTLLPARLLQKLRLWRLVTTNSLAKLFPASFQKMIEMLPRGGPLWETRLSAYYPAKRHVIDHAPARATVCLFAGCVGSVLFQKVNRQTIRLLQHAGCDVIVPRLQTCCGAIHHHAGDLEGAKHLARQNIDVILPLNGPSPPIDFIVNNISGCGAALKDLEHLLRDDPVYADRAKVFAAKTRDISELLVDLETPEPRNPIHRTVTFHHACHLIHAQKVDEQPLKLLKRIKGLRLVPLVESDMCCGAAGTYNLTQPQMSRELGQRKIRHIQSTGATCAVTANVGCAMQIESEALRSGIKLDVVHPVSLLHEAYFGS